MEFGTGYAIAVAFMFGVAFALAPFIAFAMYLAFDGDRARDFEDSAAATVHH
jgi:hypothetical protein